MKIAVIGSGPLAIEAACEFLHEGADVRVIGRGDLGSKINYLASQFPNLEVKGSEYLRERSLELLCLSEGQAGQIKTYSQLWQHYYNPLIQKLEGHYYQRDVLRVQKRFLHHDEKIEKHSRLYDLFRVTYGLNTSGMVEEQLKENPELAEKLEGHILDSLKNQVESFEDFDLVFDTRGSFQAPLPLGAGENLALNEKALSSMGDFYYGFEALRNLEGVKEEAKTVTLVGDGNLAALALLSLAPWLEKEGNVLNLVTEKTKTLESFFSDSPFCESLTKEVKDFISKQMTKWREGCIDAEKKIHEWRDLPSHEKMKIPQPQFPEPKLRLFEGYSISSCDKLIDQEGVFLTMEIPAWRDKDNEKKELVTLAQEKVLCLKGFYQEEQGFSSRSMKANQEPGYFSLSQTANRFPAQAFKDLEEVREKIFQFFSRA